MRVDQNPKILSPAPAPTPVQPVEQDLRAQAAVSLARTITSPIAAGLTVSISRAGRLAASSVEMAVAQSKSPLPQGLMDGVPWPVGLGPPPWPESQGAATVTKLLAAQVPQLPLQNPSLSKAPSMAEIVSGAAQQAKTLVQESAKQAPANLAAASPQLQREPREASLTAIQRKVSSAYAGAARAPTRQPYLNEQV